MLFGSEIAGIHPLAQEKSTHFGNNFGLMQDNSMSSLQYFSSFLNNFPNFQTSLSSVHEFTPCISNNSTSDEGDELQLSIIDERKQRRMISNRESARRSRMRKQKQLDELNQDLIDKLNENQDLIDKLNDASESHDRVLLENARLKEEASDLRHRLTDIQLATTYNGLRDLG